MTMSKKGIVGLFLMLLNVAAMGFESLDIVVAGLFKNQVVLVINHQQRLLKVGKISPEGVRLISANSQNAVL